MFSLQQSCALGRRMVWLYKWDHEFIAEGGQEDLGFVWRAFNMPFLVGM